MPYQTARLGACGEDVRIDELVVIRYPELVRLGSHVAIDGFFHASTALEVGSYVHIGPHVSVIGGRAAALVMRDFTGIAAGCRLVCASDDFLGSGMTNPMVPPAYRGKVTMGTIVLEKHSLLGTNCVVLPGVRVGEGAVAAAGSVIKHNMEPWTVYAGNPARPLAPRPREAILEQELRLRNDLAEGKPFGEVTS